VIRRIDFVLFGCLILCAIAVVNTQHRARRVFVDLEREKTMGDELAADLRRLQAERATLAAANRVERVAIDMKMHLPDARNVIVMGNQSQDVANASAVSSSVAMNAPVGGAPQSSPAVTKPTAHSGTSAKTKQAVQLAKRGNR